MLYPQNPVPPVCEASSWASSGPPPLVASGQLSATCPPAPTVTDCGTEGSDSPYAVAAVIS